MVEPSSVANKKYTNHLIGDDLKVQAVLNGIEKAIGADDMVGGAVNLLNIKGNLTFQFSFDFADGKKLSGTFNLPIETHPCLPHAHSMHAHLDPDNEVSSNVISEVISDADPRALIKCTPHDTKLAQITLRKFVDGFASPNGLIKGNYIDFSFALFNRHTKKWEGAGG